jgi:hypothetical protein
MKMSKQFRIVATVLLGGIVVASSACSVDGITPTSTERTLAPTAQPNFAAGSGYAVAEKAAANASITDGKYAFTIDPRVDQVISLGKNRVVLPANSVCAIGVSGYGPTMWDKGCNSQRKPFTLTVTVAGSGTENAGIDFQPAMRFSPQERPVMMYLDVPGLSEATPYDWTIFYCPTPSGQPGARLGTNLMRADPTCVDESLTDSSLRVVPDYQNSLLARRLKHFSVYQLFRSGYVVGE